ncbi:MAG: class I SAM-dependent methyltransferase [Deinococcus sp.]|uniref:class I SAM-dependent methyltransferase n=1 Tax=Deinococcus sp. TaxID=47478 RepID=UPI0026DB19B5|nr:class I SAM-dependent methyltransferase [Deinococcus sp.]MDO4245216.1 class I SAM-dependent methyltransferase [Deinococcus sp.]
MSLQNVTNPFDNSGAAERYSLGRPAFHGLILERLRPYLRGNELGADVACGTGLSSVALAELVSEVRAYEISGAMLAHALPHPRVAYAQAAAESLPLPDNVLDVLTVAQAFHWFDRQAFLQEARRTLKSSGVLALYDDFFVGEMGGQPTFTAFAKAYFARYPAPARHREPFGEADAQAAGFSFTESRWQHPLKMTKSQLLAYLLTHSNIAAATEAGTPPSEITAWLEAELAPFYETNAEQEIMFSALLTVCQPL